MYTAGITALSNHRYDVLKRILEAQVRLRFEFNNKAVPVIHPVIDNLTNLHDTFKWLPGHERHYAPRSEYIFKSIQPHLEDLLFLGRSYESLFDRFEIFLALVYADTKNRNWGPLGRFAWKYSGNRSDNPFAELLEEAKKEGEFWIPLKTGFFQGSYKRFQEITDSYQKTLDKLRWR